MSLFYRRRIKEKKCASLRNARDYAVLCFWRRNKADRENIAPREGK